MFSSTAMTSLLLTLLTFLTTASQAIQLATPQETAIGLQPTSSFPNILHPTAPASPELVRRMLEKRTPTQTCGYWGTTYSWVCSSNQYCAYGPNDFGCFVYDSRNGSFQGYQSHTKCLNAAGYSSICAPPSSCSQDTVWCNNVGASECLTYAVVAQSTLSGFKCGTSPTLKLGSLGQEVITTSSSSGLSGGFVSAAASSSPSTTSSSSSTSAPPASSVRVVTTSSGSDRSTNAFFGAAIRGVITTVLLQVIVSFTS